jgi:OOP family OmpA-OmpF porin
VRDDDSTAYTLLVGYRFSRYFALEAGYANLGEYTAEFPLFCTGGSGCASDIGETSVDGLVLNAIGVLPVARHFQLKASLGLNYHDLNASLMVAGVEMPRRFSASDTSFSAGLGIGVPVSERLELGLDLTRYRQLAPDLTFDEEIGRVFETNATVVALGARYRF